MWPSSLRLPRLKAPEFIPLRGIETAAQGKVVESARHVNPSSLIRAH